MKILIVAATEGEISMLKEVRAGHDIDFLVTGPGMVATTHALTRRLALIDYDLSINCGLAGSFDRTIKIGEVVQVKTDTLAELGAEDDHEFLSLAEIGLDGKDTFMNTGNSFMKNNSLKSVAAITVNTVHGNEESIRKIIERHKPGIETMEGAAFFYVCEKEEVPAIQLRAISNYVEKRNRDAWNIPLSLKNLKSAIEELLTEL